jgi:nucleoside-diphosphate-sugar epimerase
MRLLLTGAQGFTGQHLSDAATQAGYAVSALTADLQDATAVREQVQSLAPTHVIHLAGISHVTAGEAQAYYSVNLLGSINLLEALSGLSIPPQKVILASSSNVYGNNDHSPISEDQPPSPISHYAMSKLAMEYMSRPYCDRLPIVITRPFNYTGVGHPSNFVIPTIVDHFKQKATSIELGNLEVLREYNDVRDICQMYLRLLELGQPGLTYNLATGRTHSLGAVIGILQNLCGYEIAVKSNPQFMRAHEIHLLAGDGRLLQRCIGDIDLHSLEQTLKWMLESTGEITS